MFDLKKLSATLIPLSLMTMTGAFADQEIADCCQTNCCPPTCCKPCCVPQPKKCIDCECYNPQFYDLQCDWGVIFSADFLYWYARESNLEFANTIQYTGIPPGAPAVLQLGYVVKHHYLKTQWDPGFRIGLGLNSECDGWDMLLNYTYFHNHKKGSQSAPTLDATTDFRVDGLINGVNDPWASPIDQLASTAFTQVFAPQVSAKWSLNFNQIDLEVGKKYWVSKCFTLRPYTGLRGAWTHTNFHVVANNASFNTGQLDTISYTNSNKFRNKFWGVGILGGLQPQFVFGNWCGCGVFSLYGNLEGALIWGKFKGHNALEHTKTSTTREGVATLISAANPVEEDNFSRMQGILDLGIGIRWEDTWCCDRYMTTIDLGWEHHYWVNFGLYHRTIGGVYFATINANTPLALNNFVTDLGLGGFVLRFRFDF